MLSDRTCRLHPPRMLDTLMKKRNTCSRLLAIIGSLSLAIPSANAATDLSSSTSQLLELSLAELVNTPIITASRSAEYRDQTPAHIVVITRKQIRERRYKNLADLLEDLPGVDFQRGTKSWHFNQFSVQGNLGPNRLLILQDGVRINQPLAGGYPVAENLALYQARQVEFLYGPAAALYGADAVSGVVNIITEPGNQTDGSWVSTGAGSFNSREHSFMAGFNSQNDISLSLGGHWQESDRDRLDKRYKSHFRKVDMKPYSGPVIIPAAQRERYRGEISSHSLFGRFDVADRFTLGYYRHQFSSLTSTVDPYATTRYSSKARWITTSDTLYGRYRFALGERLNSQLQLDYSRMEVDPRAHYDNRYSGFRPSYSYSYGRRIGAEQSFDWAWRENQQVQFGLGIQRFRAIESAAMPFKYKTSKAPGKQDMYYPNTGLPMSIAHDRSRSNYGYMQLLSQWSDSFSTTVGFRFDHHSAYSDTFNPRLGLVWKPQDNHVFKLLYGEAFRAPSAKESLGAYGVFSGAQEDGLYQGEHFRIANPDLNPEKVRTLGLVWEWRPTRNLNLISNLYHSRISDLIVTKKIPGNITSAIPGATLSNSSQKVNAGRQRHTGLDLSAQWRFRLDNNWTGDLWASAGWIDGRVEESGTDRKIPYTSSYRFKAGTTFRYRDSLTVTPKIRWTDRVTNGRTGPPAAGSGVPSASCNSIKKAPDRCTTPGYTVMDLHIGWHSLLGSQASLWLDIYNLTDKRYYAAAASGDHTFWDMPQQSRNWMISAEWRF